jgi:hypothetical protein
MSMKMKKIALAAATAVLIGMSAPAPSFAASALSSVMFQDSTGLTASDADIQKTWAALQTMGTTSYVGGMIGSFKLDESSLLAGALTVGVTEFDNFLKTGSLSGSVSSALVQALSSNMSSAAGINLSSLVGSFTSGGGVTGTGAFDVTSAAALSGGGQCDPGVSSDLVNIGKKHVEMMRDVALGDQYGISTIGSLAGSGTGTGFASMGCLDKLFQNAGSDILFKPPSLGNLLGQLQNWTCPKFPSVADMVNGGFGDLTSFNTQSMGGFFPVKSYGEANDGNYSPQPGMGNDLSKVFGNGFGKVQVVSNSQISSLTNLTKLFQ